MRKWLRSSLRVLMVAGVGLILGEGAASNAGAAPKGPVPPGQPFQTLQAEIDQLTSLAPRGGVLWVDPQRLVPNSLSVTPGLLSVPPGAHFGASAASTYFFRMILEVPVGFAITGVKLCYIPGSHSQITFVQLFQTTLPDTSIFEQ